MDILRVLAIEEGGQTRLVMTTANRMLARHLAEKFNQVRRDEVVFRQISLVGNARIGMHAFGTDDTTSRLAPQDELPVPEVDTVI